MNIHAQAHLGLPAVRRTVQGLLVRGGPLTQRELTRLAKHSDCAAIQFRDERIANATIVELLALGRAAELPTFKRRSWPLAKLGLASEAQA